MVQRQEEFLNRVLANLLVEQGIQADFERRAGRRRMDVVAEVEGLRVALEAETGFQRKAQAIKDADARLRQGLATVVFAVCYPAGATEDTLAEATLTWTLRLKAGAPPGEWSTGDFRRLAQAVMQAPGSLSGADRAAQALSVELDAFVQRMRHSTRRELARALDLPSTKPKGSGYDNGYFVAAKRGMLVVATAMLFHHRVQGHLPRERPEGCEGEWPPASPSACAASDAPISAFQRAWDGILAVDYRPVFETGQTALSALSFDLDMAQAIRNLSGTVSDISQNVSGLRHDLLGRIFHRVLDTARYDGSFYTSTAAAVLLASLALREEDGDWADPNFTASLRICDPACGTGTLLMAAAERIRDLRAAAGRGDAEDEEALGLILVEDVLWGYDVNLTATHMAASTIGMLSPTTRFSRMNVHRALLGVYNGKAYLGSLDFLHGQASLADWPSPTHQVDGEQGNGEPPPPMDMVIMNPPFTRDSLRHDQFSREDELAIKQKEKEVFDGQPYKEAARLHSAGGAFTVLADDLLKADIGIVALVLPSVVPTAPGNFELRKYLAQRFYVDTIVTSHDPDRIYFSENTSIGEILLVCRRWNSAKPKPPTRVVNLAVNPATPIDALDTADRIRRANKATGSERDFTLQLVEAERIERGDWYDVNFLSPFLVEAYRTLSNTSPASVSTVQLGDLADIGPGGQRIRDAYTRSKMPTPQARRALWHHKTDITQSMRAETDVYLSARPGREHLADNYWEQRSPMLLPHRLRLNVARVSAVILPGPALGSIWTPCRPHDPSVSRALCMYLNSTIGLLALLGRRDNRVPSYPSFSLDTLRNLPVPDFTALDAAARKLLDSEFDRLSRENLLPLPKMHEDPVRMQIDDAVTKALGLDAEWVADVRGELSREPSVTNARLE